MLKKAILFSSIILCICGVLVIVQYNSITELGENMKPEQSDVIIVLGAGVWENGPSPAMRGRVNHAAELYHQGFAPKLIVSGGQGDYPPSEAEAMKAMLLQLDVPDEAILLEGSSSNTEENMSYSTEIMGRHHFTSAIIVTDVFHLKRALLLAQKQGIQAYGSAAKNTVLYTNKMLYRKYTLREVAAIYWYTFTGKL